MDDNRSGKPYVHGESTRAELVFRLDRASDSQMQRTLADMLRLERVMALAALRRVESF